MSSINSNSPSSPGDRSAQDEQVRRQRETYQQRETETTKKQGQQIKRLTEAHAAEIEELKEDHAHQLDEMKSKTRDLITTRDMKYQKEIEELRGLHQQQLQRIATDAEGRQDRTESTLKSEIDRVGKTTDQQKKILQSTFNDQIRDKDQRFEEYASSSRLAQQEETENTKRKMNRRHGDEMDALTKDRDERMASSQQFTETMRHGKDQEIKRLDHQRMTDQERLLHDNKIGIERERENNRISQTTQQTAFSQGMNNLRQRYEGANEKLRRDTEQARDALGDSVDGRLSNRVQTLEAENIKLREDEPRARVKADQEKSVQVDNVRRAMQANIDQLERTREESVGANNMKSKQEIDRINKDNSNAVHDTHQFYQGKMAMDSLRNGERFSQNQIDSEKILTQEKTSNSTRFQKLKSFNETEQGKMRAYFERASQSMKENFETTLRDMRDRTKQDQEQYFSQFSKQAQENDAKFQQKLADLSVRYENHLAGVQEDHLTQLKDQQTVSDRQRKELEKKSAQDMRTQASQFEYRIGKLEETHKREIEQVNRRHEETLANLTKSRQA